jgi:hypothetical protein
MPTTKLPSYLFEADRRIGTVVEVGPDFAKVNLPLAAADEPQLRHGERVGAGEVGEFVMIESGDLGIFGRLSLVRLSERDRLSVEPGMGKQEKPQPLGTVQLLCSVPVSGGMPHRGIARHPRVGARVYSMHPSLIGWIAEHAGGDEGDSGLRLALAHLPEAATTSVRITPERLFGRHCAILGATGGGKSWTLARIVERCAKFKAKVLLLDATGEYHTLADGVRSVSIGTQPDRPDDCEAVALPYQMLAEEDLFALFRPAGQVQTPKLREAMKSLKIAALVGSDGGLVDDGCIPKADRHREPYDAAYALHATVVDAPDANFDIERLGKQVVHECVYPSAFGAQRGERDYTRWGSRDEQAFSQCTSLIGRLESYLNAPEFAPVLRPGSAPSVFDIIDTWLGEDDSPVLRISLRHLAFTSDVREIVANGLGRHLLSLARRGRFAAAPLVVCLDEAHQFVNRWLGDEYSRYPLDAFDLIAKEGRKYSLSLCLATQRPRDIPDAVLGQMGTLLVHRLTNDGDRQVVERAAGDIDRSAAAFLPSLSPGQALLLGVDYPIPLVIAVTPPTAKPDSRGPDFQSHWRLRTVAQSDAVVATDDPV